MKRGGICLIALFVASALAACEPRPPKPKTEQLANLLIAGTVLADPAYRVDIGTAEERDGSVRVEPRVTGPAGKSVRYEVDVRRGSQEAKANSSQSGSVRLDDTGKAQLSSNAVRLSRGEQYEMNVKLFEGGRLVAEQTARRP